MTERQYKALLNFTWNECDIQGRLLRDQIEILNYNFMWRLDLAITYAKMHYGRIASQFKIYDFTFDKHNPTGYHPKGRASDGAFWKLDLFQSFLIFEKWRFGGIGLYPHTHPDKILHIDDRNYFRASRWVRSEKEYIYSPIFFEKQLKIEGSLEC